ncbi:general substrate transporter [Sphaerulina musiva SO2202]|uniref:General substrate transporter n=1 Tax=Sphaerulina musiva (strain SO2202) TaxID=692275 RepID=N1QNX2_SPHMS|nr:general substrate transporter [Sphaerulina musiva SO2202]EMF17764.1 general substrate transporter [Sphaerulina musiva SO2202]
MGFLNRKNPDAPSEILNWRLWYGVFVFGLMGAARGVDEGLIGTTSTLPSFSKTFGLKDKSLTKAEQADRLSNITSMVQLGSIGGALIAFYVTDKVGRLWATRQLCLVWVLGISIFLAAGKSGHLGMVYAGRFIAGLGIGQTTVVAPTYLAEISPKFTRGLCVCMFSGSVYLGIMLGYFSVWGCSLHISPDTQMQWVIPNMLHIYFAAIIFITSFLAVESPRWLLKVGKVEQAVKNLSTLRHLPEDHWYVQAEIMDVKDQLEREREATMGTKWYGVIRELVGTAANRYRLMLSVFSQLLSQWSGANSITIYAPEYFALVGQTGSNEKLFATAIFGVVKFISALLCAFFLIDYVGRKRSLMIGITLQFVAMLYMAGFLLANSNVEDLDSQPAPIKRAATGAIVMIYLSGFGWAMGWNSIQYLINSEIYPLRLRAIGGSFAMTFHFVNQYGNSKAVPEMFLGMTHGGTMMFFCAVTLVGLAWAWFFLPELAGKSLEDCDAVFQLPWYVIGRKGKQLSAEMVGALEQFQEKSAIEEAEVVENVQDVQRKS